MTPLPASGVPPGRPGWWDRWTEVWQSRRDRWLASPSFRRRAAAFALTRPFARRRARELFDLVAGFVYSQVLLACVRLRLFDLLADGPLPPAALAARLQLPLPQTLRLLDAACALRLLQRRRDGRYALGPLGAPMVGNAAVASMVEHHAALYADLADPVALLRGRAGTGADGGEAASTAGALAGYWPYAGADLPGSLPAERVAAYSALMAASQPLVADEILDAYALQRHRCLLDVGGGDGSFLCAAAQRAPALQLQLFDLPAVAERATARLAAAGLGGRARVHGGSFFHDALPTGADIATLVRVVHDHDDEPAMALLRAVRRALPADGTLLLAEPMADTPGARAMGDAYFGFYLLAMGSGRPRDRATLSRMLEAAGFQTVRPLATHMPLQTQLLVARVNPERHTVNPA